MRTLTFIETFTDVKMNTKLNNVLGEYRDYPSVFNPSFNTEHNAFSFSAWDRGGPVISKIVYDGQMIDTGKYNTAKLFSLRGKLYAQVNDNKQSKDIAVIDVEEGKIIQLYYKHKNEVEKNWIIYEHGGEVYCIYQIAPLIILKRTKISSNQWVFEDHYKSPNTESKINIRGGSPATVMGDSVFFMGNQVVPAKYLKVYFGNFLRLNLKDMVVSGTDGWAHNFNAMCGLGRIGTSQMFSCTYFSGMEMDQENILLSYGVNDVRANFARIPIDRVGITCDDIESGECGDYGFTGTPHELPRPKIEEKEEEDEKSLLTGAKKAASAVESIINTKISKKNRATDHQIRERLDICKNCPSGFVELDKKGRPYRCGKIDDIFKEAGKGKPCGCILKKKARDTRQQCPAGHWPTIDAT